VPKISPLHPSPKGCFLNESARQAASGPSACFAHWRMPKAREFSWLWSLVTFEASCRPHRHARCPPWSARLVMLETFSASRTLRNANRDLDLWIYGSLCKWDHLVESIRTRISLKTLLRQISHDRYLPILRLPFRAKRPEYPSKCHHRLGPPIRVTVGISPDPDATLERLMRLPASSVMDVAREHD
jgi:hypothetical protein